MNFINITFALLISAYYLILPTVISAQDAKNVDVKHIMTMVDSVRRQSFVSAVVKTKLSTSRYLVREGRMVPKESPRVTVIEVGEKKYGKNNEDSRSMAIILEPISDKGIGMLTYEYDDPNRDNDVWLYLPVMGKVRRLISGNEENEDGGSFFGTEYFLEDVAIRRVKDYSYKMIGEETYDNRPAWVIESVPIPGREKKTKYSKIVTWVDKERNIALKEDLFDRNGKHFKQRFWKDYTLIDNVWAPRTQMMNNLVSRRFTTLNMISATYNKEIVDEFFTQRTLTDLTFREKNLEKIRVFMK